MTQIAAHLCLSGFVRNNWEEVAVFRTGIGFRPCYPLCRSEQALVVKQFRCGCIRGEWRRWLRPRLGSERFGEGMGGWIAGGNMGMNNGLVWIHRAKPCCSLHHRERKRGEPVHISI